MKREIIENEEARLNALRNLRLLDTPPSESFDRITRMAGRLLGAPVSTISLTDRDRQWFKSRFGVDLAESPAPRLLATTRSTAMRSSSFPTCFRMGGSRRACWLVLESGFTPAPH